MESYYRLKESLGEFLKIFCYLAVYSWIIMIVWNIIASFFLIKIITFKVSLAIVVFVRLVVSLITKGLKV
ncbi:hypothetical protein [Anaeromicrobium sediminis]|uniref:Uncharacterized protein n=1 Tax=Anaeromicrobium sediminis TaxID=1478221 RepID=A0A267MNL1_9FIRM|nr:hypothetical protein [Anaeromicrobium sediminis]PAB61007.1 hypothetical protein CCE28_00825 [Anaeromicrobium sediminis]